MVPLFQSHCSSRAPLLFDVGKQLLIDGLLYRFAVESEEQTLSIIDNTDLKESVFISPYLVCIGTAGRGLSNTQSIGLKEFDRVEFRRGSVFDIQQTIKDKLSVCTISMDDAFMSGHHANLERASVGWQLVDKNSKNGVFINGEKVDKRPLSDSDIIEIGHSFWVLRTECTQNFQQNLCKTTASFEGKNLSECTFNPNWERDIGRLRDIASVDVPVLINGQTGTGKEWIARYIHTKSMRRGKFIAVNCGAISVSLMESEFFGHVKGSFSGAIADKKGFFSAADNGTIFLDEIGELPLVAQSSLLRVLQEKEISPVGSAEVQQLDFRVVVATHVDLKQAVADGAFREDLFHRLNGHQIVVPPLGSRKEDLGLLIRNIGRRILPGWNGHMSRVAMRKLSLYGWPGNIRELEHALRTALALSGGGAIHEEHLTKLETQAVSIRPKDHRDAASKEKIIELLKEHRGNVSAVARKFGKARVQIRRWCKKYAIDPDSYR